MLHRQSPTGVFLWLHRSSSPTTAEFSWGFRLKTGMILFSHCTPAIPRLRIKCEQNPQANTLSIAARMLLLHSGKLFMRFESNSNEVRKGLPRVSATSYALI
jgi:hypothetical protein